MKNKYVLTANRWWLAIVWLMSVVLPAQAQTSQPPVIEWQRVVETNSLIDINAINFTSLTIIKNSRGGYSALTGDRRLLSLTSSGDVITDTPITSISTGGGETSSLQVSGLAPASDGGFVVGVRDNLDVWSLQMRDASGALVWVTRIVGSNLNNSFYSVASVVASPDGGFVVFGTNGDRRGASPVFVSAEKFNRDGVQVWYKDIRYSYQSSTFAEQIIGTPDGGYLLAGGTSPSSNRNTALGWAAKLDEQGNTTWQKLYERMSGLNGAALYPAGNNGTYVLNGFDFSSPPDLTTSSSIIIDNVGNLVDNAPTLVPFGASNSTASITAVPPAGKPLVYVVANGTRTDTNGGDLRLTGFSDERTVVWTKTLGGSGRDYRGYKQSVAATDDGFIVVGVTTSTDGDVQGKTNTNPATWIVKLKNAVPANALALTQPTYNCQTGVITFNTTGGDGSPITYNAPGISRSSLTSNTGTVEQGLRNDPKPITITATQSGYTVSYTFDFGAFCVGIQPPTDSPPTILPPVVNGPIPSLTRRIDSGRPIQPFIISEYFSDPTPAHANYRSNLRFSATNLAPGLTFKDLSTEQFPYALIAGSPFIEGTFTATITATNLNLLPPNNAVSTTLSIQIIGTPEFSPDNELRLMQPDYDCQTGRIVFRTVPRTDGNTSPVVYNAPGVTLSSSASDNGIVEQRLRTNPEPITITATQGSKTATYVFDLKAYLNAYCNGTQPPVNPPTPPVNPPTGGTLTLTQPTYTCQSGGIVFNTSGGDGSSITYNAPGISRANVSDNFGTVEQGLRNDPKPITITATQSGQTATYTFDLGAYCATPQPPTPPAPPATGLLTLLAPTYDCASGAITFRSSGGNGSGTPAEPIEYAAAGITGWTTNPNQLVDRDSRTAGDVKPFTLMARQNGQVVTYVWDLKAACGRARVGVGQEAGGALTLTVLGNPTTERVRVVVGGAEGQPVRLVLSDGSGRVLESRLVERAEGSDEQVFELHGSGPGLLLLGASSGTQAITVKIIKQ